MPCLHALRRSAFLARSVLAWMVLSIGAAVAAPVVQPQVIELVCIGDTVKAMVITGDGVGELGEAHLDCPLCLPLGAPAPLALVMPWPLPVKVRLAAPAPDVILPGAFTHPWHARAPPLNS